MFDLAQLSDEDLRPALFGRAGRTPRRKGPMEDPSVAVVNRMPTSFVRQQAGTILLTLSQGIGIAAAAAAI